MRRERVLTKKVWPKGAEGSFRVADKPDITQREPVFQSLCRSNIQRATIHLALTPRCVKEQSQGLSHPSARNGEKGGNPLLGFWGCSLVFASFVSQRDLEDYAAASAESVRAAGDAGELPRQAPTCNERLTGSRTIGPSASPERRETQCRRSGSPANSAELRPGRSS